MQFKFIKLLQEVWWVDLKSEVQVLNCKRCAFPMKP